MATKNMSYDHPAYLAVLPVALGRPSAGANASTHRFVAFTTTLVKSISAMVVTSGTSTTHVMRSIVLRNGGTSTETAVLFTLGSAALSTAFGYVATTLTLSRGDAVAVLQGTDATMQSEASLELIILPGADVTA